MKKQCFLLFAIFALSIPCNNLGKKGRRRRRRRDNRRQQKPINQNNSQEQNNPSAEQQEANRQYREQRREKRLQKVSNVLCYAANIVGNAFAAVRDKDRENIIRQVGKIANNVVGIVAEVTRKGLKDNHIDVLDYLNSNEFVEQLTEIVIKELEEVPTS